MRNVCILKSFFVVTASAFDCELVFFFMQALYISLVCFKALSSICRFFYGARTLPRRAFSVGTLNLARFRKQFRMNRPACLYLLHRPVPASHGLFLWF